MSLIPEADVNAGHPAAETALTTLRPAAHRDRFIHLQTTARTAGASDPTQRLNTILELLQHYRNAAGLTVLLSHDWDLYLALEVRLAAASAPLNPEALHAVFELHKNATSQFQSQHLIMRYISLVLAYFSRINGVDIAVAPTPDDEPSSSAATVSDPALKWTSLDSCPTFDAKHGAYLAQSLPPLSTEASNAGAWEAVCGLEAVRSRLREAYARCAYQLQESQSVWKPYLAFEEALLTSPHIARDQQVEAVRQVYLARLKVPHAAIDDTFQAFSQFVTQHLPPHQYESEMSAANTLVAESKSILRQREQYEDALGSFLRSGSVHVPGSRQDLDSFATYCKPYLRWQTGRAMRAVRGKDKASAHAELDLACALYERLITVFGLHPPTTHREELVYYAGDLDGAAQSSKQWKRLSPAERATRTQQEAQLLSERLSLATDLWLDYISLLTSGTHPDASLVMDVCTRSVHCLPTAAGLHAALMRNSARFRRSRAQVEQLFERVATPGALSLAAAELTDLCLARVDCERELATYELVVKSGAQLDADPAHDMDKFTEIYALLSYALGKVAEAGDGQYDASLRLERTTVNWVERAVFAMGGPASEGGAGFNELAEQVWQTAVTQQPDNMLVYREAAAYWLRRFDARKARGLFKAGVSKVERKSGRNAEEDTTQYQALLNDWLQLEHQYGSIEEIEHAEAKVRAERQRALEAWYASYAQYGYAQGAVAENGAAINGTDGTAMQIEAPHQAGSTSAGKRKADDDVVLEDTPIADAPTAARVDDTAALGGEGAAEQKKTRTGEDSAPARDREHCSVLVAGLDPSTDAQAVRSLLRGCGRIVELSGPTVLTHHSGSASEAAALVEFSDASGASSALTRHGKPLGSTHVSIHIGWKCTLFVTNFPEAWTDAEIRSAFAPYGLVFNVRWPSKRFVSTRRFCYVQYTTPSSASAAVAALDGREVAEDRRLSVAHSDPSRRKARTDAHENTHELFVSGFPRNITEDEMRTYFEAYGKVTGVRLLRTAEGALRGIGFVDFENALEAQRAMRELNSTKWRGKTIAVTMAENRGAHGQKMRREDVAERRTRSVRVHGLPEDAQEALIQQALEQAVGLGSVAQVLWTQGDASAIVAFGSQADAGKAVLLAQTGEVRYADQVLDVKLMDEPARQDAEHALAFVPRASRGRGRGRARAFATQITHATTTAAPAPAQAEDDMQVEPPAHPSGQDRFRAMLNSSPQ